MSKYGSQGGLDGVQAADLNAKLPAGGFCLTTNIRDKEMEPKEYVKRPRMLLA